ncbi:MAG: GNAT family N-acetyltransferase, partial [Gemmatimonadota bacterium]|nr:GNAT family N-acetyltransferase [Gemmatimonadota bacterium]
MTSHTPFRIAPATEADVPLLLDMIRELAAYERLADQVVATESGLREALFRVSASVEAVIARGEGEPLGFALFFHNFSTFLGRRGLYLEDLYVRPEARGDG